MEKTAKNHCLYSKSMKTFWKHISLMLSVENTSGLEKISEDFHVSLIQTAGAAEAIHSATDPQ